MQRTNRNDQNRDTKQELRGALYARGKRTRAQLPTHVVRLRASFWLLASSVLNRPASELNACAADVPKMLPDVLAALGVVIDQRTLSAWMLGKGKHADVLFKADAAFSRRPRTAPGPRETYLQSLVAGDSKYCSRPDRLGAYVRLFDSFDLCHEIDDPKRPVRLRDQLERARALLNLLGRLYAPRQELRASVVDRAPSSKTACDLEPFVWAGHMGPAIDLSIADVWIPDSPWTVLGYLLLVAIRGSRFTDEALAVVAMDLAAAYWASRELHRLGAADALPTAFDDHVAAAEDLVEKLLDLRCRFSLAEAHLRQANDYMPLGGSSAFKWDSEALPNRLRSLRSAYQSELGGIFRTNSALKEARSAAGIKELENALSDVLGPCETWKRQDVEGVLAAVFDETA
jgi:hypothetical protein